MAEVISFYGNHNIIPIDIKQADMRPRFQKIR